MLIPNEFYLYHLSEYQTELNDVAPVKTPEYVYTKSQNINQYLNAQQVDRCVHQSE